jgi:NinB protein
VISWTINHVNREALIDKIRLLDITQLWQCEIRLKKSKRTVDQNARLWAIYKQIAEHIGLDSDEVHQLCGYKFLRYQKDVNGKTGEFITSTTKLNTAEMAFFQEQISRWALDLGIYIEDR